MRHEKTGDNFSLFLESPDEKEVFRVLSIDNPDMNILDLTPEDLVGITVLIGGTISDVGDGASPIARSRLHHRYRGLMYGLAKAMLDVPKDRLLDILGEDESFIVTTKEFVEETERLR